MAKSSGNPAQSQQQPVSPKRTAAAVPEPKLVAGAEVIGCQLSVLQMTKPPEFWDGKVIEFDSSTGKHLVRYTERVHRSEEWLQLTDQPFNWTTHPPLSAAVNPTVKGISLNDSILGHKVKVFWTVMSKWYQGQIKAYDAKTSQHTIKYRDGQVKDHVLRHEAVIWLDNSNDVKSAVTSSRSKGLSSGSHSGNANARKVPACSTARTESPTHRHKHSPAAAESSQTTSPAAPKANASQAPAAAHGGASPKRLRKGDASSPRTVAAHSSLSSTGNGSSELAAVADDDSVSQSSCSREPADTAFPDDEEHEGHTQHAGSRHAPNPGANPSRLATLRQGRSRDWTQLAEDTKPSKRGETPKLGEPGGALDAAGAGDTILGARVGIFWKDDQIYYKGQLAGFDAYHKRSKVCYDDGQEEWVSLMRESFRWYTPRGCTSSAYNPRMRGIMLELGATDLASQPEQPPNSSGPTQTLVLDQHPGHSDSRTQSDSASTASAGDAAGAIPQGNAAVGWRVSIWSHAEGRFVAAQIIAHHTRQRAHHVLYEDGEEEWLRLPEEHVQWHSRKSTISHSAGLPPGHRTPKGLSAVGWRVGIYWVQDQKFYLGKVLHYDKDEETQYKYHIKYDDGEEEDVDLTEQPVKWILPPSVVYNSDTAEVETPRPRRQEPLQLSAAKTRRQPSAKRHANGRGVARQKSRLGINCAKSGIQKHPSLGPKPALTPLLTPASLRDTPMLHTDPSSSPVTAPRSAPAALAGLPSTTTPLLLGSASIPGRQAAVAQRLPSVAHMVPSSTGSAGSVPRLDRVIGPAPRRAPHLAGTRVKIFCSQASRGVKSSRPGGNAPGQDADARRVRRRLEAINQMIWRCECADRAITKGAPVPSSSLMPPDAAMHLDPPAPSSSAPAQTLLQGSTVPRIAAHLGIATSSNHLPLASQAPMPASQQLPADAAASSQLPAHQPVPQQPEHQLLSLPAADPASYDSSELIHQLPSSAPMLLDAGAAVLMRKPTTAAAGNASSAILPQGHAAAQHRGAVRASLDPATVIANASRQSPTSSRGVSPRPPSRSPSIGLTGASASRQASPNSLAELVPSTTAVTVPPYSVISAAKASLPPVQVPPVEVSEELAGVTAAAPHVRGSKAAGLAVKVGLKGQESIGVPDTPDQSNLILSRERSSLSKDQADVLSHSSYMSGLSMGLLNGGSHLAAPGMLYSSMAMSTASADDLEPDMLSILLDGDTFVPKSGVSSLLQD